MSDELLKLRTEIDAIDEAVLTQLSRRAQLARRIGEIKQGNIYRPEREAQVLRRIASDNPGPLPHDAVVRVFREIMSACLALEQPLKVAYLGPAGTFSESAAKKHFGHAPKFEALAAIDDVFRAVESNQAHYGVVPVENSTEGAVGRTLDLLLLSPIQICGEVTLRVHQNLLSKAAGMGAIKRLYSHAQSLAQCHEWLNRHLGDVPRIPVGSNAEAARLASEDEESAAIAGTAAAELYGLDCMVANIEDDPNNTTRFVVIAHHDAGPSGQDRTSLVCAAPNRPGAVHALIEPFARNGVSLSKLQSRPARSGMWEYVFYMDIDGHQTEPAIKKALTEVQTTAAFVKILGSYPMAL